jgi:hypothetical protein
MGEALMKHKYELYAWIALTLRHCPTGNTMVFAASAGLGYAKSSRWDSLACIKSGIDTSPDLLRASLMGDPSADCMRTEQTWSQVCEHVVDIGLVV